MRITKTQLRKIIKESMAQSDVLYLENLLMAWKGTFGDWSGFCDWYDSLMADLRVQYDEEMDDFLMTFELEVCPESIQELLSLLNFASMKNHPMFSIWARALRQNF